MNILKQNIFKVLTNKITKEEFENLIYQEQYVNQIDSNNFITSIIEINYRNKDWKYELSKISVNYFGIKPFLILLIRSYCLELVLTDNHNRTLEICNSLGHLYWEYDSKYFTLWQFYHFEDDLDLIDLGYSKISSEDLMKEIKAYGKLYLDKYDSSADDHELLNLDNEASTFYQNKEVINFDPKDMILKNKKWYQFWK